MLEPKWLQLTSNCWMVYVHNQTSPRARLSSSPTSTTVDERGRIMRPPDALRPLSLCNCDCNVLATAICFGLRQHSIACVHPVQRCVATGQMTDNKFVIETAAIARTPSDCEPLPDGLRVSSSVLSRRSRRKDSPNCEIYWDDDLSEWALLCTENLPRYGQ